MIKRFKFIYIFLSLIFFSGNSNSLEPNIFIQSTVNRASQILGDDIPRSEKIEKLKIIATDTVDIKGIGFYT